ncbi:peptide/nickel transport system substrate-binding protein [Cnuella takakiae]|uniref:Peptide/nickel transport system substrate-binding protein n=1 Tax=Cnuella takakiae TaxID=1302690 RepID=A0A1M5GHH3_9BACT|nr:ABC transporter substrate-binding protein [Cnuella takakiae]OLY92421.1 ABC transporter substrate-binding protein [Cnuella takakiae]SHG03169.1 peptide/nickel transport system substrate-binding protein [Cnuella takakiae]
MHLRFPQYWLFACLLLLAACYNSDKAAKGYFYYNEASGIASLDPAFAKNQSVMWPIHQLYNTLVEPDSALHLVPSLAKGWNVSEDRTTYTFYLRNDVFFHDDSCFPGGRGRKMTAQDVVFSLQRLRQPGTASPGAWIFNNKVDSLTGFTAIDDTTFQLQLLRPYQPILGILSMQYCSIVPREAVEKYGAGFRRHPVGSGPFRLGSWQEGQALVLHRNEHYWEKDQQGKALPYLEGIRISFAVSKATEFLLFRQGKLHFINDLDPSFKDEVLSKKGVLRKEWMGKVALQTHPYLNIEYLGFLVDTTNPLLRNNPVRQRAFRRAINMGFNREQMILYLRNSLGIPAQSGFVPAGLPSFDSTQVKGYRYNPVAARKLLQEAGFGSNNPVPIVNLLTIPIYADMADYIARQLEEIGIRVEVEVVQKSLLLELTSTSRALFFRGSWIADYPDAENYLSVFYSRNPAPPNYTRYHNPRFDALFEKALAETNDSLRYALYRQADQLVMEDAPVVPLWYDKVVRLVQPGVAGFQPNALNMLELRRVYFTGSSNKN